MSQLSSLYSCNARELVDNLVHLFERKMVPYVRSSPGMGKSAIYRHIAQMFNLEIVDIRLSMYEPHDFSGLAFRNGDWAKYLPFDLIPIESMDLPKGKDGWLIILDEFNHAQPEMIRASYKLILDRMVGENKLHDCALVCLAGNNTDDNALANNVGTALNSRVTHLKLTTNVDFWIEDVAIKYNLDHRIIGFINSNKDKLNDFDPENTEHSFCSQRTWEFVSNLISGIGDVSKLSALVAGTISPGVAAEFIQFCAIYQSLVSIDDVIKDPALCHLPSDSPTSWALITHLAKSIDPSNAGSIGIYVNRMPVHYVIIFLRMIKGNPVNSDPQISKLKIRIGGLYK